MASYATPPDDEPPTAPSSFQGQSRHDHANVHRGAYELSIRATDLYEQARARVARFIGAGRAEEVVFTRSTTEAINLVAYAWGRANLSAGDVVVVTEMEHHSNLVPWHLICGMTGATIEAVRMTDDGGLDLDSLDEILARGHVKLVTSAHVSNALGTIHPVAEIARRAHAAGALYLVDGAQAAPHGAIDVRAAGCDFYALSGHKMCGPTGIGALWGRKELLEAMPPFNGGGEMIDQVWADRSTYAKSPARFEAGTPHIAGAVGLAAAIEFLEGIGMEAIAAHEAAMARLALERLAEEFPAIRLFGPGPEVPRAGVISFTLADIHPHDLATPRCLGPPPRLPRPCSLKPRSWTYLTLSCIMPLCTPGFEFPSASQGVKSWRSTRT